MVATTTEDPVAEAKSAPDTAGATNGAAALKGDHNACDPIAKLIATQVETGTSNKSAPDTTKSTHGEAVTKGKAYLSDVVAELTPIQVDSETSKKRSREADDTTEVNTEV